MQIKPNRPVQIATLAFAVTVFATYVVYSQRQRTRLVTPASLSVAANTVNGRSMGGSSTNHVPVRQTILVAPGSKAMAPVLDVRPAKARIAGPVPTSVSRPAMVASGSKSAPVFDLRDLSQIQRPKATAMTPETRRTTNTMAKPHPWRPLTHLPP